MVHPGWGHVAWFGVQDGADGVIMRAPVHRLLRRVFGSVTMSCGGTHVTRAVQMSDTDGPVVCDGPARVVRDFPHVAVRVGEGS